MSTDRIAIARILGEIADHLEFKGENPFRVRAFKNAARAVIHLPGGVEDALADGSLAAVRGIGPATLRIVTEFLETGRSRYLDELRSEIPPGLLDMMSIPGLGVTRVRTIHAKLGVDSVSGLEAAARSGALAALAGFGPKSAEKVLKGIRFIQGKRAFRLSHQAAQEAAVIGSSLARLPGVRRAVAAGEVRRCAEVVGELTFVLESGDGSAAAVFQGVRRFPGIEGGTAAADWEMAFQTPSGLSLRILVAPATRFGAALVRGTGSEAHLRLLAEEGAGRGVRLDGITLLRGNDPVDTLEEADVYRELGLAEIPPELREGLDEVERARAGTLPILVERGDLRGLLHCHSTWSDGTAGIAELAEACRKAGYEYLGLTDHSQAAAYAGGLRAEDLPRQWEEIDRVNATASGVRVLKGIESDILSEGRLDYDDATLGRFEFVMGSVHSRLGLGAEEMTARLLRALDHPSLTLLGHPTGRLLLAREAYALDLDRIFARAAERGVGLEINGDPHRLDLDWRLVRQAREAGVPIAIGADAHSIEGFGYADHALTMARKAGLTAAEVLNTRSAAEFLAFAGAPT